MALVPILSESERQYILEGVRQDIREDGRSCNRARYFSVKTGVVSNTSGSAKINRVYSLYHQIHNICTFLIIWLVTA